MAALEFLLCLALPLAPTPQPAAKCCMGLAGVPTTPRAPAPSRRANRPSDGTDLRELLRGRQVVVDLGGGEFMGLGAGGQGWAW